MASVKPEINKAHDLGTATHKWGVVHAGDVQTETLTTSGDVEIGGNLIVQGSSAIANVDTIEVEDPLIKLAKGNTADILDIGFYAPVQTGATISYVGIFRDASTGAFRVFEGATEEPTTTVGAHQLATLEANIVGEIQGVAAEAAALETPREIALSGAVTGSVNFDGTADVEIVTSLSYSAPVGTNYIDGATSLANADTLLDSQIKTVADDLSSEVTRATGVEGDLQSELDDTQSGAGLETDGSYVAPVGSNYLGAATSLKSADSLLDSQVKTVADGLASEITRASGVEGDLQSEIDDTQSGAGLEADGSYVAPVGSNYLAAATSLKGADSLLDSQVKTVADGLASEITRATGAEGDLQSEIDDTQSGAGLEVDGSYVAPVGSNYLGAATSLKSADSLLDSQVKTVADGLASEITRASGVEGDLQSELDATQSGAGLGSDGAYSAPVVSNYLASATSLKEADSLLDL